MMKRIAAAVLAFASLTTVGVASAQSPSTTDDGIAARAAAIATTVPVTLPLIRGQMGWMKLCPSSPETCRVSGAFAIDKDAPNTMALAISPKGAEGYDLNLLVPLNIDVGAGIKVSFKSGEGYEGEYTVCSPMGCAARVTLSETAYQEFISAPAIGVIVKDANGRVVQYQAPLVGMAEALSGPPLTAEQVRARRAAAEAAAQPSKSH